MLKYNIVTDKQKITINCSGKVMKDDLSVEYTGAAQLNEVISSDSFDELPLWKDIALNEFESSAFLESVDFNFLFKSSNRKDAYCSYNTDAKKGIYHINLETGEIKKIYELGNSWQFFFEDSKGNIYVSSSTSTAKGIVLLKDGTATLIYSSGYYYSVQLENSQGNIYFGSTSNGGVVYFDGQQAMFITGTTGSRWPYFYEASNGNIYIASSTSDGGIGYINGTNYTNLYNAQYSYRYIFEDSQGNIYFSSSRGNSPFIVVKDLVATSLGYYHVQEFVESSEGIIYAISNTAIYQVTNSSITTIEDRYTGLKTLFADSNGRVFVGVNYYDSNSIAGFIRLYKHYRYLIDLENYGWTYFCEDSEGNVYACATLTRVKDDSSGIIKISKDNAVEKIFSRGVNWKYSKQTDRGLFIMTEEYPYKKDDICVCIKDNVAYNVSLTKKLD